MGSTLTVNILHVVGNDPKLAVFPLVSGAAGLAFLVAFLGVTSGTMAIAPEDGALARSRIGAVDARTSRRKPRIRRWERRATAA